MMASRAAERLQQRGRRGPTTRWRLRAPGRGQLLQMLPLLREPHPSHSRRTLTPPPLQGLPLLIGMHFCARWRSRCRVMVPRVA